MDIGISFYYGTKTKPEIRAELIKNAGFNNIITINQPELINTNLSIENQCELFRKNKLKLSSLHMQYRGVELPEFWKEGVIGDKIERTLKEDIETAKKFNFTCVVVHLAGKYSEIGEKRLLNILEHAKKYDIPLAIENVDFPELFFEVFENIKHNYLMMCYDSGHNNVFDKNTEYINKFKDKIIAVHLHDNMGMNDDHTLNKFGNINWNELAKKLAQCEHLKCLDYELLLHSSQTDGYTDEEILNECYKQGVELKTMILNYKK